MNFLVLVGDLVRMIDDFPDVVSMAYVLIELLLFLPWGNLSLSLDCAIELNLPENSFY